MGDDYVFRAVETKTTIIRDDVKVAWRSKEDGGPPVCAWYRSERFPAPDGRQRWSLLVFANVLLMRYHNEHLLLDDPDWTGDEESSEEPTSGLPWRLEEASSSWLLQRVRERLTTRHLFTQEPWWCGHPIDELVHYRLMHDHDGHYDIVVTSVEISVCWAPDPDTELAVVPDPHGSGGFTLGPCEPS